MRQRKHRVTQHTLGDEIRMEFDGKIENSETTLPVSEAKRKRQKGVTTAENAQPQELLQAAREIEME